MQSSNTDLLRSLLQFIRHPSPASEEHQSILFRLKRIFTLISWLYVIVIPIAIIIRVALTMMKYNGVNAVDEFTMNGDIGEVIFLGVLFAPFIEEVTFRLPLRKSPLYIALSSFMVARILLVAIAKNFFPHANMTAATTMGIPLLIALSFFLILRTAPLQKILDTLYSRYFPVLFYSLTLLFGLLHISNYSDIQHILIIVLLLGVPQIVVGVLLGYVRLRYGFVFGLLLHGLYNGILIIPTSLVKDTDTSFSYLAGIFGLCIIGYLIYGLITLITSSYQLIFHK
jgi:hypothetical protein